MPKKKAATTTAESGLEEELRLQRRKVDFDTFDIVLQQLLQMLVDEDIDIAPAYQRQYRWDDVRASQLIESLFLAALSENQAVLRG